MILENSEIPEESSYSKSVQTQNQSERIGTQNQSERIGTQMIYHWSIFVYCLGSAQCSVALGPLYISELGTQDTSYVFWHHLLS